MLSRRSALTAGAVVGATVFVGAGGSARAAGAATGTSTVPVIPAVQTFTATDTGWRPTPATRLVMPPGDSTRLGGEARTLAAELVREGHLKRAPRIVDTTVAAPHDIVLRLAPVAGAASPEAYRIDTGRHGLTVTGRSAAGVFHGTRTLLQVLRGQRHFTGAITDWPLYRQRGLMVDVGRKYFTPAWLEDRIRELAWLKLNVLHLHLSDSLGFRVESDSHPEIVTRPALTKDDVRRLVAVAKQYHVTIVPEIDSPGHMAAILAAHPELQLVRADGRRDAGNLDYSKPEARRLMAELIDEYAELFPGPWFHLGGDEYFGYPWDSDRITGENAPQLLAYARQEAGPDATLLDGFTTYMNGLIAQLADRGKRAKLWNDHVHPGQGTVELDRRAEIDVWIRWNTDEPSVEDYVRAGYDVVNAHGDHLYFILAPGQQHETGKKSAQGVYDLWTPRTFMRRPTEDLELGHDAPLSGAHLSIWCDNPGFQSEREVAQGIRPWLRSFAQHMWGSAKPAPDFAGFATLIDSVGDAPAGSRARA